MALNSAQALTLSQDQLAKWLLEDIQFHLQIAPFWPFIGIQGGKLRVERTQLEPTDLSGIDDFATILADGGAITDETASSDSTGTFTIGELAVRYQLDYTAQDRFKYPNDMDALESALSIKRLLYMYFRKLDLLDAAAADGDFLSLRDIARANRTFAPSAATPVTSPGVPVLDDYYKAYWTVTEGGRPNAIMSNSRALRQFVGVCQAAGFQPQYVMMEWEDPIRGTIRVPVTSLNGTPWYINDLIATEALDDKDSTRIYFMNLGETGKAGGPNGVFGIVPAPLKDTMFVRRETPVVEDNTGAGVSVVNVDYAFPVANAVASRGAIAVLDFVDVTSIATPTPVSF